MRQALWLSIRAGLFATAIALLLGSTAAFAVQRFRFFGREAVSFVWSFFPSLCPESSPGWR